MEDEPMTTSRQTRMIPIRQVLVRRIWDLFRSNLILLAELLPGTLLIICPV